jgi:hypothetical protein
MPEFGAYEEGVAFVVFRGFLDFVFFFVSFFVSVCALAVAGDAAASAAGRASGTVSAASANEMMVFFMGILSKPMVHRTANFRHGVVTPISGTKIQGEVTLALRLRSDCGLPAH